MRGGARVRVRVAAVVAGGALLGVLAGVPAAGAVDVSRETSGPDAGRGGLVIVLDSSGSMADGDGSGRTRMEAARSAVSTVVDGLPDGHPTGLRVYGADRPKGCTDTRLVRPVRKLDREALKRAVNGVRPRGDTPIGLSLQKAAQDLPRASGGSIGQRTVLLISDGEDNCGTPQPCEVAKQLGRSGVDLRIDAVGFQVKGAARKQLECLAKAGNGRYYDAPDAAALARQLQRAAQLSADGYRFQGKRVEGAPARGTAPALTPGQYLDTIGPGETRYYAADLDAVSTVNFSATAVPQPGAAVDTFDALKTRVEYDESSACENSTEHFLQNEGATPLTSAVARVPSQSGTASCDKAGRYWLAVERVSKKGSDAGRWPLELTYGVEKPLPPGTKPGESKPEYGAGDEKAPLPAGDPKDVRGGTGFNDARQIAAGVWRDRILPSQTLWYKVPAGWGQQVRYDVEFANEPTVEGGAGVMSYGMTQIYTPARAPVGSGSGGFDPKTLYTGRPAVASLGTVPVAWTNRYESHPNTVPVHDRGSFYIAVSLGAKTAEIAENPQIGVVLRVAVLGDERSGPQHDAPLAKGRADRAPGPSGESVPRADSAGAGGAGWSGTAIAAVAGGTVVVVAGAVLLAMRRRTAANTTRGGS
ncbi:vWA domain-containing protein [Streptomyces sp. NPDC054863]